LSDTRRPVEKSSRRSDPGAVDAYIRHRLAHAGTELEVFSDAAIGRVAHHAAGIPRLVNKLCEFCLVYGAINEEIPITEETVNQVISDGVFVSGFLPSGKAAE
jgi:hypothetical protein